MLLLSLVIRLSFQLPGVHGLGPEILVCPFRRELSREHDAAATFLVASRALFSRRMTIACVPGSRGGDRV